MLSIMAYTVRIHPKAVSFSGFRYSKGWGFNESKFMKGYGNLSCAAVGTFLMVCEMDTFYNKNCI